VAAPRRARRAASVLCQTRAGGKRLTDLPSPSMTSRFAPLPDALWWCRAAEIADGMSGEWKAQASLSILTMTGTQASEQGVVVAVVEGSKLSPRSSGNIGYDLLFYRCRPSRSAGGARGRAGDPVCSGPRYTGRPFHPGTRASWHVTQPDSAIASGAAALAVRYLVDRGEIVITALTGSAPA